MNANNKLITLITVFLIIAFNVRAQQPNGFEINGNLEGLENGEKITLKLIGKIDVDYTMVDSALVNNGKFHLSGVVPDGPRVYYLEFEKDKFKVIRLFIDNNEHITIDGKDIYKIPHDILENYVTIKGSRTNDTWHYLTPVGQLYFQSIGKLNHYLRDMKDSVGFDPSIVEATKAAKDNINEALYLMFLERGMLDTGYLAPSVKALFVTITAHVYEISGHPAYLKDVYEGLDEKAKNSYHGKILKEYIKLCVGQPFPTFTLPNPQGKLIALKDIVAKGKLTLVHIWASNSVIRQKYQEELRALYKKYHAKGLNIIGLSADSVAKEWKARVLAEEYPWENVSDLKGNLKGGIVDDVYHEGGHSIPNTTNVLLDEKGRIIAWDPTGVELQWYLWKYLDNNTDTKNRSSLSNGNLN